MPSTVTIGDREYTKEETPVRWAITLPLMFIAFILSLPVFLLVDSVLWLVTREHWCIHHTSDTLVVGWKKGTKFQ